MILFTLQYPAASTTKSKMAKTDEAPNTSIGLIDLNKARHEVKQFGIKGFDAKKKEDAVVDMLVKLGAKVGC